MTSHNVCNNLASEEATGAIFLLSLNDSVLSTLISPLANISIMESRKKLMNTMINQIPGKLLFSCRLYHILWTVIPPIILIFGSIGNVLACIVLCHYLISKCSSYIYLAVMVVIDESILLTGLFRRYLSYMLNKRLENESTIFCQLSQFIGVSTSLMSVWLIVVMTVERVIIIYLPLRAKQITQKKIARSIIGMMLISSSIIASHFFFTVDTHGKYFNKTHILVESGGECSMKSQMTNFFRIWTIIDASLYSFIPSCVLISLNILIVWEILRSRNKRMCLTNNANQTCSKSMKKMSTDTQHLSITLIAISFIFLVTTTPLVLFKLILYFKGHYQMKEEIYQSGLIQLIDVIFEMLMYVNHSINFLLYCATGNRFRQHVLSLILCGSRSSSRQTEATKFQKSTIQMSEAEPCFRGKRYLEEERS